MMCRAVFLRALKYRVKADTIAAVRSHEEIVFVGSSVIEYWSTLQRDLSPLPVWNHGIAGTTSKDALEYINETTLCHSPRFIVYYYGSNDSFKNSRPTETLQSIETFFKIIREKLPQTKILFMTLQRAPLKSIFGRKFINSVNDGIGKLCDENSSWASLFDMNAPIESSPWRPARGMYRFDQLHPTPGAYTRLASSLKPQLQILWESRSDCWH